MQQVIRFETDPPSISNRVTTITFIPPLSVPNGFYDYSARRAEKILAVADTKTRGLVDDVLHYLRRYGKKSWGVVIQFQNGLPHQLREEVIGKFNYYSRNYDVDILYRNMR